MPDVLDAMGTATNSTKNEEHTYLLLLYLLDWYVHDHLLDMTQVLTRTCISLGFGKLYTWH